MVRASATVNIMLTRYVVSQVKQNSYFLCGLAIGLWVALVMVPLDEDLAACASIASTSPISDEFAPQREERPASNLAQIAGARSVQRPRYYSTELGMRGSLLAAVMTSQEALDTRAHAINHTAAQLQPGLRFFITASSLEASPGRANVVGFTDAREMLKPFHALKYLADNYLEEYNFFFLVSDTAFVNAPRLQELVSKLSVSQDVYMGIAADDDSQYCSLEGGIVISNSVLRAVHTSLDWCVRNSYSPHHHENLGRCVLHASQTACTSLLQGQTYSSALLDKASLTNNHAEMLAEAVTARPVNDVTQYYQLHAFMSRVHLQHSHTAISRLTSEIDRARRRPPPGYHNATWPRGLRDDPGLAPPVPPTRFDHLRWTLFNATHAFFPDDHNSVLPLTGATKQSVDLILQAASAWLRGAGADPDVTDDVTGDITLVEGAWKWTPATSLTYKLLLRDSAAGRVRQLELVKPLGSARLVPVRYVTESARVTLVLPVTAEHVTPRVLAVYKRVAAADKNTELIVVLLRPDGVPSAPALDAARAAVTSLKDATVRTVDATVVTSQPASSAALKAAMPLVSRDALLLLVAEDVEFNDEFLNRVSVRRAGPRVTRALLALGGRLAAGHIAWRAVRSPVPRGAPLGAGAKDEGEQIASMSQGRCAHGTAALAGRLLVVGGYDRAQALKSAESYDPGTNTWSALSDLRGARARFPAARLGDCVYAVGGSDGQAELDSVLVYKDGGWSTRAKLPLARSHAAAAADETSGQLYCVGGWNAGVSIRTVHKYSPEKNEWSEAPPLNIGRSQCAAVVWEGALWALGGCDAWHCLASTETLPLPETASTGWVAGPPLPTARRSVGGCVWRGRLVSAGGSDGAASLNRTDWLAPGAERWLAGPPLRAARAGCGLAVLGDVMYAVGGFSGKEFLASAESLRDPNGEWTSLRDPPPLHRVTSRPDDLAKLRELALDEKQASLEDKKPEEQEV